MGATWGQSVPFTDREEINIYWATALHQMICEMNRYRPGCALIDSIWVGEQQTMSS